MAGTSATVQPLRREQHLGGVSFDNLCAVEKLLESVYRQVTLLNEAFNRDVKWPRDRVRYRNGKAVFRLCRVSALLGIWSRHLGDNYLTGLRNDAIFEAQFYSHANEVRPLINEALPLVETLLEAYGKFVAETLQLINWQEQHPHSGAYPDVQPVWEAFNNLNPLVPRFQAETLKRQGTEPVGLLGVRDEATRRSMPKWSIPRSPSDWLKVFGKLNVDCRSQSVFYRRRRDGTFRQHPESTTKSIRLALDCLPPSYRDEITA